MSNPPDSAWLDDLLGGTDGVEIPPQSQGPGPIVLSQMYRDAAMLEQESLALAAESQTQKRRLESEMPSAVPKMAKTSVSQTHVSTPATASPAGPQTVRCMLGLTHGTYAAFQRRLVWASPLLLRGINPPAPVKHRKTRGN